jgi:hypothetical protein
LVCICVYSVCAVLCLGRGPATSWSLVGVLQIVNRAGDWKTTRALKGCTANKKTALIYHLCRTLKLTSAYVHISGTPLWSRSWQQCFASQHCNCIRPVWCTFQEFGWLSRP